MVACKIICWQNSLFKNIAYAFLVYSFRKFKDIPMGTEDVPLSITIYEKLWEVQKIGYLSRFWFQ